MRRYKGLRWLSLLLVLVLLVGCAAPTPTLEPTKVPEKPIPTQAPTKVAPTKEPEPTQPPAPTEEPEPVMLSFIRVGTGEDALMETDAQMAGFYEMYPWITLETLPLMPGDIGPKILTAVAGGKPPDLAMVSQSDFLHLARSGALLDLMPLAEADGWDWKSYYNQALLEYYVVDGKFYGIQDTLDPHGLVYNTDIFDAAGMDYPDETWTWDDMIEAAQALTLDLDGDGTIDQWGFVNETYDYWPWIRAAGGKPFSDDYAECNWTDPAVVEALQFMADLRHQDGYGVAPDVATAEALGGYGRIFRKNHTAAMIPGHSLQVAVKFAKEPGLNIGVAPMPKHPRTGLRGSTDASWAIVAFAGAEHPEEAYRALKWMVTDEGLYGRSVGLTGVPLVPPGPADKWPKMAAAFETLEKPAGAKFFLDAVEYTTLQAIPIAKEGEFFAAIEPYLDDLWLGNKTAAEVAPLIQEACAGLLKGQ